MKILLLSNKVPYPADDGSSIAIASMIDGLLKNEVEVTLLSLNTSKHFKEEANIRKALPPKLNFSQVYLDNRITRAGAFFNLLSGQPFHVSRFKHKPYTSILTQLLHEEDFDLIQLEGLAMAVYLPEIRKYTKAKIVLRAHNLEGQIWQRLIENEQHSLKRKYLEIQVKRLISFEMQVLKDIDALVPITDEDLKNFRELVHSKIAMSIPCGIDIKKYEVCKTAAQTVDLAYLASFDWLPNRQGAWWFVNEVWPVIRAKYPEATFKLGGRHMSVNMKAMAIPGIQIVGEVQDMPEFICNARLVVVPLLAGSGMRIKILENMALGKCQVSTSIGAEGIDVQPGKNIVLADDPEEMATRIVELLKDSTRREAIGMQARKTAEVRYNNRVLGQRLLEFYETEVC